MSPRPTPSPPPPLTTRRSRGAGPRPLGRRTRERDREDRSPRLAREHLGGYDTGPQPAEADADRSRTAPADAVAAPSTPVSASEARPEPPPHPVDDAAWRYLHDLDEPRPGEGTPPFGLPVLAEIPGLATVLEQLREADRLIARALEGILLLQDHADVVGITGISLDTWLATIARRTRADARMLLSAAEMMRRLPTLRAAFQEGRLSWAQVRAVALKARPLPCSLDDRVDEAVAAALDGAAGSEPDAVTRVIAWSLAALQPRQVEQEERREQQREFLGMQPRLDGTGGRLWGEFSATSWAVLDAALNEPSVADLGPGSDSRDSDHRETGRAPGTDPDGTQRAARLVELLDQGLAGGTDAGRDPNGLAEGDDGDDGDDVPRRRPTSSRPQLLLRADLDTLLDREQTPGALLTNVLGGHVRASAPTVRRLVEERGADLRTVILDDTGSIVGVGRRVRIAPGWLRDAVLALHDTCAAPGCNAPARASQLDHARPWQPARPEDLPGSTDVGELAPLCPEHNRHKERSGWTARQSTDGRRSWTHRRSGLTTRTIPATWRPQAGTPPGVAEEPAG